MPDIPSSRRAVAGYLALLALAYLAFSCDQGHQTASGLQCGPHPVDVVTRDFADAFAPLQPLVFRTTDPSPVLSVRALSVSPSGHLLVTDSRSGDLKLADGDGRIIRVIGREGEGPGEFTALFDAVFLSDDRIVALDGGRVLTTLFDSAGEVLNTFQLREQLDPRAVVAIDDSTFLIGGLVGGLDGGGDISISLYPRTFLFRFDTALPEDPCGKPLHPLSCP